MRLPFLLAALVSIGITLLATVDAFAERCNRCSGCRSSRPCCGTESGVGGTESTKEDLGVVPGEPDTTAEVFGGDEFFSGASESFASAPASFAPNMIGDFSGTGTTISFTTAVPAVFGPNFQLIGFGDLTNYELSTSGPLSITSPIALDSNRGIGFMLPTGVVYDFDGTVLTTVGGSPVRFRLARS